MMTERHVGLCRSEKGRIHTTREGEITHLNKKVLMFGGLRLDLLNGNNGRLISLKHLHCPHSKGRICVIPFLFCHSACQLLPAILRKIRTISNGTPNGKNGSASHRVSRELDSPSHASLLWEWERERERRRRKRRRRMERNLWGSFLWGSFFHMNEKRKGNTSRQDEKKGGR